MQHNIPQVDWRVDEEWENPALEQTKENIGAWKKRALEALKRVSGPLTPKTLAEQTGTSLFEISSKARQFPRTFNVLRQDSKKKSVTGIDLHPDLRAYVEYEKASH